MDESWISSRILEWAFIVLSSLVGFVWLQQARRIADLESRNRELENRLIRIETLIDAPR